MNKFEKIPSGIFDKIESNKEQFLNKFIDDLEELFPETVKDGAVDFKALLDRFGEYEEESQEKYNMTWIGKNKAIREADEDIYGRTLRYVEEESKNPETTENLYIEGDNLEVLKLLRKSYYGKIKMIYIDPPYNTGSDFVYKDDFSMTKEERKKYEKLSGEVNEYGERLVKNTKDDGKYHSKWLNMMYPRLRIARDLLTEDGVIFISIDDNEVHNTRKICDEIFHSKNMIGELPTIMNLKGNQDQFGFAGTHEYTLVYAKQKNRLNLNEFNLNENEILKAWEKDSVGYFKRGANIRATGIDAPRENRPFMYYPILYKENELSLITDEEYNKIYNDELKKFDDEYVEVLRLKYEKRGYIFILPINTSGEKVRWRWGWNQSTKENLKNNIIVSKNDNNITIYKKQRPELGDIPTRKPKSTLYKAEYSSGNGTSELEKLFKTKLFENPKPVELIKDLLLLNTDSNDIILDFFSGSGTTAQSLMELNFEDNKERKYIIVQLPEDLQSSLKRASSNSKKTIENAIIFLDSINKPHYLTEIGKERIRRAGDMIVKENKDKKGIENLDIGFKVFKTSDTNLKMIKDTEAEGLSIEEHKAISLKDKIDFNPHFTDLDVVYEMILRRQDIELSEEINLLDHIGERTYLVGETVLICLEDQVTEEMVKKIGDIDMALSWIIMRDSAFDDNINLKINTVNLLRSIVKENHGKEQQIYWI